MDARSLSPKKSNMARRWARRIERYCCTCATYFPLLFVYSLTSWAAWVIVSLGTEPSRPSWVGSSTSATGVLLYLLLNWSYTTAVFTPPGSTTNDNGYSTLPTHAPPVATSFTVKSNGETRFCKKCQARKPDRAHHCSTCRRCVLKMDHHCPWLATCIGLRNHKAFLLFLIYTTLFSLFDFAVAGAWVWGEIASETTYVDSLRPVQYIMLCVIAGIISLVVGAFTVWHIILASRGQTTIECLEKTRYLSPLRKTLQHAYEAQQNGAMAGMALPRYGQQLLEIHQNALPGITRPEEGEETRPSPTVTSRATSTATGAPGPEEQMGRRLNYDELERYRARKRYEEYLDEQDSEKLPNAFDLGWRRNLLHLFGRNPWLWAFPICNTTGDGWSWEPSPRWLEARERIRRERDQQRERERAAGWGQSDDSPMPSPAPWARPQQPAPQQTLLQQHYQNQQQQSQLKSPGPGRNYLQPVPSPSPTTTASSGWRTPSKADRILGRDPNLYADEAPTSVSMRKLSPMGREVVEQDNDDDSEDLLDSSNNKSSDSNNKSSDSGNGNSNSNSSGGTSIAKSAEGLSPVTAESRRPLSKFVSQGSWDRIGASGLLRKPSLQSLGGGVRRPLQQFTDESGNSSSNDDGGGVD